MVFFQHRSSGRCGQSQGQRPAVRFPFRRFLSAAATTLPTTTAATSAIHPSTALRRGSGQGSGHALDGAVNPFQVYLTCYRVLKAGPVECSSYRAGRGPRVQEVLGIAYRQLQERATKIADEAIRRSFLENVAAHREIVWEWTE